jgi:hypothetical protein|tara:strand:- start:1296 stop:1778 length:483 start_codon:yes stop_codon:yes gene_type:complete
MATGQIKLQGAKEIEQMFGDLPKQIKQYNLWKALWRKIAKGALNDAKSRVPKKTGQLKNSLGFFTTRKTKNFMGLYLGPRVKRAFRSKEKSGFYGAFIEYGDEVIFYGKGKGKAQKYMQPAWDSNKIKMTSNAFKEATKIAASAIKRHEKRMKKYGTLGY